MISRIRCIQERGACNPIRLKGISSSFFKGGLVPNGEFGTVEVNDEMKEMRGDRIPLHSAV